MKSPDPYSSLAQLVERVTVNHDVVGSSPTGGVMIIAWKGKKHENPWEIKGFRRFYGSLFSAESVQKSG